MLSTDFEVAIFACCLLVWYSTGQVLSDAIVLDRYNRVLCI